ncbi:MAG TPA: hypothetical protein DCR46_02150 [Cytophagales bacterium]|nr:hypothetical protein [Cytophagales bacterium]
MIEDEITISGIKFRFIDTAGLRETSDQLEAMGIARTRKKMEEANVILYLFDVNTASLQELEEIRQQLQKKPFLLIANKIDKTKGEISPKLLENSIPISAATGNGIEQLKEALLKLVKADGFKTGNTVVTNARHHQNLTKVSQALSSTTLALDQQLSNDFLALEVRQALYYLGELTGTITTEDLLGNIFSRFCIGK